MIENCGISRKLRALVAKISCCCLSVSMFAVLSPGGRRKWGILDLSLLWPEVILEVILETVLEVT